MKAGKNATLAPNVSHLLNDGYVQMRWEVLNGLKSALITRSHQYADWTMPRILPRDGEDESSERSYDYQSVGAGAVNTMSNKLGLTMFTPWRPIYKLSLTDDEKVMLKGEGFSESGIQEALTKAEIGGKEWMERVALRPTFTEVAKHCLIVGNALMRFPETADGVSSMLGIKHYCVNRDHDGTVRELIIQEETSFQALKEESKTALNHARSNMQKEDITAGVIKLYTYVYLVPHTSTYAVYQALDCWTDPSSATEYDKSVLPFYPAVWNLASGDDYGTGLVEDYANDFHGLSGMYASINTLVAVLADIKFVVDVNAGVDIDRLNNGMPGEYVAGRTASGVSASTKGIAVPFDLFQYTCDKYEKRINTAFMMYSGVVRDAERVTAEEIRTMSQELEAQHGATWTQFSNGLQMVASKIAMKYTGFAGGEVEPTIVTGLDALSRSTENNNLRMWLSDMAGLENVPESMRAKLKEDNIASKLAQGYGIVSTDYVKSEQEQQADQEQQLQILAAQNLANNATMMGGNNA